jgi:hypothetical protein
MSEEGLDLLRALLARTLEQSEQETHSARPQRQRKPFRYYVRRNAHRTLARFASHGHNRCTG